MKRGLKMEKLHGKPYVDRQGYLRAHEYATRKCRRVHRMVWEHHHGRKLQPHEHIHHIDGNKQNNAVKNLGVVDKAHHQELHGCTPMTSFTCRLCGRVRHGREQEFRSNKTGCCYPCTRRIVSKITSAHIVWYWVIWPAGKLLGPYDGRREAIASTPATKRKSRTLCSLNRKTLAVRSGKKKLPASVTARIRAGSAGGTS